jgi:vancomycin resistance protein YoaR
MALFEVKTALFRLRRSLREVGRAPPRLSAPAMAADFSELAAESRTPLWVEDSDAEHQLEQGKVRNLRLAAQRLDGLLLPAGAVFSFWRQVGEATRARGYVEGRMLREGCLMPAVGGGLCQLSNALYDVALTAGCRILERHAHSRIVPGSAAAAGRDATVAWNYVDLRFESLRDLVLEVALTNEALVVALRHRPGEMAEATQGPDAAPAPALAARSCDVCGETNCFMHQR